MRKGKFINTYSGIKFYPEDIRSGDIVTEDIAHALSLLCRGNGHLKHFYSVAQHSINCAREAKARAYSERVQLACLLHDGSEAYLADITRPVKHLLPTYLAMEERVQEAIYSTYGLGQLPAHEQEQVKEIDDELLYYELSHLIEDYNHPYVLKSSPSITFVEMGLVEKEFIQLLETLVATLLG